MTTIKCILVVCVLMGIVQAFIPSSVHNRLMAKSAALNMAANQAADDAFSSLANKAAVRQKQGDAAARYLPVTRNSTQRYILLSLYQRQRTGWAQLARYSR